MSYQKSFIDQKNAFFATLSNNESGAIAISKVPESIKQVVNKQYSALGQQSDNTTPLKTLENLHQQANKLTLKELFHLKKSVQTELANIMDLLSLMQENERKHKLILLAYYCCELLKQYYIKKRGYDLLVSDYEKKQAKLIAMLTNAEISQSDDDFNLKAVVKAILAVSVLRESQNEEQMDKENKLLSSIRYTAPMRDAIAFINIWRIYLTFTIFTYMSMFHAICHMHLSHQFNNYFGSIWEADKLEQTFADNVVLDGLHILSVGLYVANLIINICVLLKHCVITPSDENSSIKRDILWDELAQRGVSLINDFVWLGSNLTSNYWKLCHIPEAYSGGITAITLLCFDVPIVLVQFAIFYSKFTKKNDEYEREKKGILEQIKKIMKDNDSSIRPTLTDASKLDSIDKFNFNDLKSFSDSLADDKIANIKQQIKDLIARHENTQLQQECNRIDFHANMASSVFKVIAANILALGFTMALYFIPALAFGSCILGTVMYMNADKLANYWKQSSLLNIQQTKTETSKAAVTAARNDLAIGIVKNLIPTLVIGLVTTCWPAALALCLVIGAAYVSHHFGLFSSRRPTQAAPETTSAHAPSL